MSTDAFIDQLYNNILAREADAEGKAYWLEVIDNRSLSAAQATQAFLNSDEYATTVTPLAQLYYTTFNRAPDAAGLAFWAGALQRGNSFMAISESFMASAEYLALYGSLVDNSDFIDQVYSNSFGRAADAEGHANWLAHLDRGMSRAELLGHFARSPELTALRGEELEIIAQYHSVLGADPGPREFTIAGAATSPLQLTEQLYAHAFYRGEAVPYFVDTIAPTVSATLPQLFALPNESHRDYALNPSITPVGDADNYVLSWAESHIEQGIIRDGRVQQMNSNGQAIATSLLHLDTPSPNYGLDFTLDVTALGSSGDYLLTWYRDYASSIEQSSLDDAIFIQHIKADGSTANHPLIQIEGVGEPALGVPVATTLGSNGDYLVAWAGYNIEGADKEPRIFLLHFDAQGRQLNPSPIELELSDFADDLKIASLGTSGRFALSWATENVEGDHRGFTQVINADGSSVGPATELSEQATHSVEIVALDEGGKYATAWVEASSEGGALVFAQVFNSDGSVATTPVEINMAQGGRGVGNLQIASLGASGEFVLAWNGGPDTSFGSKILAQKFNVDGSTTGNTLLQLTALSFPLNDDDWAPTISALGADGAYVLAWLGKHATSVQRVGNDGKLDGAAINLPFGYDHDISAVGSSGEYALAWTTIFEGDSIPVFVQTFNADGTRKLDADGIIDTSGIVTVISSERGEAYLVNSEIVVTSVLDITSSADELWNETELGDRNPIDISNSHVHLYATGLIDGDYYVYAVDEAGNLSAPAEQIIIIGEA